MSQPSTTAEEQPSTSTNSVNNESKKADSAKISKSYARYHSLVLADSDFENKAADNYQKRLQSLRKELNYIAETDWMFETSERKS